MGCVIGSIIFIFFCCFCCIGAFQGSTPKEEREGTKEGAVNNGRAACPVSEKDAREFLNAAKDEYTKGSNGAVGKWMDETNLTDEDRRNLTPFEEQIRNA